MKEVYTPEHGDIYIAVYQLVPLRQVSRQKLSGASKGTIKLKKILDKEVAEFVCF